MKAHKTVTVEVEYVVTLLTAEKKTYYTATSIARQSFEKVELFSPFGEQKSVKDIALEVINNVTTFTQANTYGFSIDYRIIRCTILP